MGEDLGVRGLMVRVRVRVRVGVQYRQEGHAQVGRSQDPREPLLQ